MARDRKNQNRKSAHDQQPDFQNDQLGENAAEHFSER